MALPPLTPEQRAAALAKGTEVRKQRAEIRNRLKYSQLKLSEVLAKTKDDEAVAKMKVVSLLESLPGIGRVRARQVMADIGIAESRRARGLGPHQISALIERFG